MLHYMSNAKLPIFPEFTKLDLQHKEELQAIANAFPSYSDFNFVSLFTWDTDGAVLVSTLNDNLVIRFSDYLDNKVFYSFLGTNKVHETVETLLDLVASSSEHNELMLIPHSTASLITDPKYEVIEDRDNYDYLLLVNDLVEFRTNKYRGKKNLLNRFNREYGHLSSTEEIDLTKPDKRAELEQVLADWQTSRNKGNAEVDNEFIAIKRALEHADTIGIRAFGVYVEGKLVGFTLFEILPKKMAVIHFDKADIRYAGVFEHLKHNFAKHISTMDIVAINYEQDLGIEGLRRAKESYHPIDYLKKYTVRLRS